MGLSRSLRSLVSAVKRLFSSVLGGPSGPTPTGSRTGADSQAKLLMCPNTKEVRVEGTIGPEGGTLALGEHSLEIPVGAVSVPIRFVGILPVDELLKATFQANGAEAYTFQIPVTLTLSFSRCEKERQALGPKALRVYKIDPRTNAIEKDLGGTEKDKEKVVVATLEGFSTYTLGSPI